MLTVADDGRRGELRCAEPVDESAHVRERDFSDCPAAEVGDHVGVEPRPVRLDGADGVTAALVRVSDPRLQVGEPIGGDFGHGDGRGAHGPHRSRSGPPPPLRPRACPSSCARSRPRTRSSRAGARLANPVHEHPAHLLLRGILLATAGEHVHVHALSSEVLRQLATWRANPPSISGGYSQDRIRTRIVVYGVVRGLGRGVVRGRAGTARARSRSLSELPARRRGRRRAGSSASWGSPRPGLA